MPTTLIDDRRVLDLDGAEAHMIYPGPAHQVGDVIVHLPSEGVLFAGDLLFNRSTPMGWVGSYRQFSDALDRVIALGPTTIVPGHGPVCGIDAVKGGQAYFQHVLEESRKCFDEGLSAEKAAERIDPGRYGSWKAPSRLLINVKRAPGSCRRSSTACTTSRRRGTSRSNSDSQEGKLPQRRPAAAHTARRSTGR